MSRARKGDKGLDRLAVPRGDKRAHKRRLASARKRTADEAFREDVGAAMRHMFEQWCSGDPELPEHIRRIFDRLAAERLGVARA